MGFKFYILFIMVLFFSNSRLFALTPLLDPSKDKFWENTALVFFRVEEVKDRGSYKQLSVHILETIATELPIQTDISVLFEIPNLSVDRINAHPTSNIEQSENDHAVYHKGAILFVILWNVDGRWIVLNAFIKQMPNFQSYYPVKSIDDENIKKSIAAILKLRPSSRN